MTSPWERPWLLSQRCTATTFWWEVSMQPIRWRYSHEEWNTGCIEVAWRVWWPTVKGFALDHQKTRKGFRNRCNISYLKSIWMWYGLTCGVEIAINAREMRFQSGIDLVSIRGLRVQRFVSGYYIAENTRSRTLYIVVHDLCLDASWGLLVETGWWPFWRRFGSRRLPRRFQWSKRKLDISDRSLFRPQFIASHYRNIASAVQLRLLPSITNQLIEEVKDGSERHSGKTLGTVV